MQQRALTLEIPLAPGIDLAALRQRLRGLGNPEGPGGTAPWAGLEGLHFASMILIEDDPAQDYPERPPGEPLPPELLIELNYDGEPSIFLARFVECARELLDRILEGAPGYPGESAPMPAIARFLESQNIGADAFYVGAPGRSVEQVAEEAALRAEARDELARESFPDTREEFFRRLRKRCGETLERLAARLPPTPLRVALSLRFWRGPKRVGDVAGKCGVGLAAFVGTLFFGDLLGLYSLGSRPAGGALLSWLWLGASGIWLGLIGGAAWRERSMHLQAAMRRKISWQRLQDLGLHALVLVIVLGVFHALRFAGIQQFVLGTVAAIGTVAAASALLALGTAIGFIGAGLRGAGIVGAVLTIAGIAAVANTTSLGTFAWLVACAWLVSGALAAGGAAWLLHTLGRRELEEPVDSTRWDLEHLARVRMCEDRQLQNHFASLTWIKPGRFRLRLLESVLRGVQLAASIVYTLGDLGGISSIHFARFVILRDRRRLLFLTNYDGPWDAYLDDFVEVPGVTAVWGNAAGFPRPFLLIGDGARDEQRFKAYARASQLETLTWYSAYPNLSVIDIQAATETRLALMRPVGPSPTGLRGLLWRWLMRPLSPAALDQAIRSL